VIVCPTRFWIGLFLALLGAVPDASADESSRVTLAWRAGPGRDAGAWPDAPVVGYRVLVSRDGGPAEDLAEVGEDTTCTVTLPAGVAYRIRVVGIGADGRPSAPSAWSASFVVQRRAVSPPGLLGISPNPFNPRTRITYAIPADHAPGTPLRLEIYDLRGGAVRRLPVDSTPGEHSVEWNGTNDRGEPQSSGAYLARFVLGDRVATLKMLLTR
jgi:hypothetical protein